MRSVLVAAATAALLAAPAVAQPSCHAVTDPAHDEAVVGVLESPPLDIRWADAATGKKELVVVLGLGGRWGTQDDVSGSKATVGFTAAGVDYSFAVALSGNSLYGTRYDNPSASVGGAALSAKDFTLTIAGTTLVWRVPRRAVKALSRPRLVFTNWRASTSGGPLYSDQASGSGSSRCVKAKA